MESGLTNPLALIGTGAARGVTSDGDPELGREFYASTTPEEMVDLAEHCGILIDADDFRALLRGGSSEFWVVGGEDGANPIVHLQQVFGV